MPITRDDEFDLATINSDPTWTQSGSGAIVGDTIVDDLSVTNATTYDVGGNHNFLLEAVLSSALPGTFGEAGARLWVRAHTDDLGSPNQFHEFQIRLQKQTDNDDNFVGLYDHTGTLATALGGGPAKITLRWDQTEPPHRIRLVRQGDEVLLGAERADVSCSDPSSEHISVALNNTNFPVQVGAPNLSEVAFGNGLIAGNQTSTWETIHVVSTMDDVTELPICPTSVPTLPWTIGPLVALIVVIGSASFWRKPARIPS